MALAFGASTILVVAIVGFWGGFRLNLTPSYPLGIWRIAPLDRDAMIGDRVFICPPDRPAFELGVERGYLSSGSCPGGTGPLIKTIVAGEGQVIGITTSVVIDGAVLANSGVRSVDAEDRPLPKFAGGIIPPNFVFVHSDFGGSFDSRYFGPIPDSGILGIAHPVLVVSQ